MVVASRTLLLSAGLLAVLCLAWPAQATASCGASAQGPSALAGGSCSATLPTGGTVTVCAGAYTTDGYTWEFDLNGFETIPGCEAGSDGTAGCEAWLDAERGPYPNEGVGCLAPAAGPACVELLDGRWAFLVHVNAVRTTDECAPEPAPQDL